MPLDLLRFTTAGSVDDGKSTLIGRLLYDSQAVYEDQLVSVRQASSRRAGGTLDLSLLTDGLRAEREQGITIDVAYRYFSTPNRKFIIADAPGHEQYTRNMATAASTADLAIVLIDARRGVLPQSRRHAYIAALLGIPQMVVAINKMDQVGYGEEVYNRIREEFTEYAGRLGVGEGLHFIPISALEGDNVVRRSQAMPWYRGPSLLEYLETAPAAILRDAQDLRFPVQYVIRAGDFRGFAGQIASGGMRPGDTVMALPSGRTSRIQSIVTWDGELPEASAPLSVTVRLEDEIDISRGDMLVAVDRAPTVSGTVAATLVWMSERPLRAGRPYLLKHAAQTVRARVREDLRRIDMGSLAEEPVAALGLNEIGRAVLVTERPLFFDPYRIHRATGSLILIDPITNETVAAGMIAGAAPDGAAEQRVSEKERQVRNGHRAAIIVVESDATAWLLERRLFDLGFQAIRVLEPSAPAHQTEVLALYNSGAVVILSATPDSASFKSSYILHFSVDDAKNTELLVERIRQYVSLR
ncbi:MAG: sulfate adenylyltransferase subunit CysN [Bryobacteraceae bacterium]